MEQYIEIRSCIDLFWRMTSKCTQLIGICSTVNKELQGIGIGPTYWGSLSFMSGLICMTNSETIIKFVLGALNELKNA